LASTLGLSRVRIVVGARGGARALHQYVVAGAYALHGARVRVALCAEAPAQPCEGQAVTVGEAVGPVGERRWGLVYVAAGQCSKFGST